MDLETLASISKIVSSIASVLLLGVSVTVGIFVYKWQRESSKISCIQKLHDDLRFYNQLVLENDDLQDMEVKLHRWGTITKDEVKKMYYYFILFNVTYNSYEAANRGAINKLVYESQVNNVANTTYDEREFIKKHVFPRGYENGFRKIILSKWELIDSTGTLPNA